MPRVKQSLGLSSVSLQHEIQFVLRIMYKVSGFSPRLTAVDLSEVVKSDNTGYECLVSDSSVGE
jgi:hypothetical protein